MFGHSGIPLLICDGKSVMVISNTVCNGEKLDVLVVVYFRFENFLLGYNDNGIALFQGASLRYSTRAQPPKIHVITC